MIENHMVLPHADDESPEPRRERDEPTHEEREEWIAGRDADNAEMARDAKHESMVADELNDALRDIGTRPGALFRRQAD